MTDLPLPRAQVFPFFAHAANLDRLTPPELRLRILTPLPIAMHEGEAGVGLPARNARAPAEGNTELPEPVVVDEQVRGPYGLWEHTHFFSETADGTRMEDIVRWALPLAPLGEIAAPLVRRELDHIFAYRQRALRHALLGEPAP